MHAGFRDLRMAMPMNLFRAGEGDGRTPGALADIARIDAIWQAALAESGGPFLFGAGFGNADVMYAPVVCRFLTYRPDISATGARLLRCGAGRIRWSANGTTWPRRSRLRGDWRNTRPRHDEPGGMAAPAAENPPPTRAER